MRKLFLTIVMMSLSLCVWAEEADTLFFRVDSLPLQADSLLLDADSMAVPEPVVPNLLDSMPGVQVIQDSAVARLLRVAIEGEEEWIEITGFRVQVYSSNQQQKAKGEALRLEERLKDQLSQTVYVQYVPPFWKVRVGDFRTYEEAKAYKKELVHLFPALVGDTYIVRDQIKTLK